MRFFVLALISFAAACGGGDDKKPTILGAVPTPPVVQTKAQALKLGQGANLGPGLTLTVIGIKTDKCPINQPDSKSLFPSAGETFVVVEAQFDNATDKFEKPDFGLRLTSPQNQQLSPTRFLGRGFDSLPQGVGPKSNHRDFLCVPLDKYVGAPPTTFKGWQLQASWGSLLQPIAWTVD